jgi:hypothetical protein
MRVFARKGMIDKIDGFRILGTASKGLKFYKEYLDCGFHFTKYD